VKLAGAVAIVTGASRGIGKGCALELGAAGATVYVTGRSIEPGQHALPGTIGATAEEVTKLGGRGIAVACDHRDDAAVARLFEEHKASFPGYADVTLVDGLITDAARVAAERGGPLGWYDVSTLKEPYRVEGKKTMGYELAEQMGWTLPDWIIYPTGGGTGMVGMWKAFEEMEALGWIAPGRRPRMVTVQADGCAPIVRAFEQGTERATMWENAHTVADGLRVPKAIGDFLVLRAVRESGGAAVAVDDADMVTGMRDIGRLEGVSAAPEGGAALHALRVLVASGRVQPHERVVLFNTGGALKYLDVLETP